MQRGWGACALCCSVLLATPGSCAKPREERANLLLVTLDTVRADRLGSYGYAAAETPALDRLARGGLRFIRAAAAVPLTLPSHATILTGRLPTRHGLRNNGAGVLQEGAPTLATVMAAAGYRTGGFVGAFVLDRRFGLAQGFEVYDDEIERDPRAGAVLEAERPGSTVVDRALAWLARDDERPFFLWVHLYDAHAPYAPPPAEAARHPGRPYDGEIAFVDAQVGRLLAALEEHGWDDSTVVAVTADHGEGLGDHGEDTHGLLLYESTVRVPLLLRAAGLTPRAIDTPVSLVDLAPTLAGLAGRAFPAPLDGRDLAPSLLGGGEPPAADVYAESRYPTIFGWSPLSALRRRDLKYIAAPEPELYDLASDPGETRNLASERASQVGGFAGRLAAIEASALPETPAPVDPETRARLASLGYVAGRTGLTTRQTGAGAPNLKRMVSLFQRFERANAQLQAGRAAGAAAELSALVAEDADNPVFRGKLAAALRETGDLAAAVPLYRQAAEDAPDDAEAWYNLATALHEAGHSAQARLAAEQALALDGWRPEAHNVLGVALAALGKPEEARRELARAVELDPRNAHALNNLGNVLRMLGKLDEAAGAYQRAAALAPRYAEPLNGLGALEVQRDRPRAALPYFERALTLAPGDHEIRLNRAIAYQTAGELAAAAAAYRDFLAASADDPRYGPARQAARQLLSGLGRQPATSQVVTEGR